MNEAWRISIQIARVLILRRTSQQRYTMIGRVIIPPLTILFVWRDSCNTKTRGIRTKNSLNKDLIAPLANQKSNETEDLAQNYFRAGPLTLKQKELLQYIQQLKANHVDNVDDNESGGRECTGEPRVDPSRQIQPNQGDSEWIDDW